MFLIFWNFRGSFLSFIFGTLSVFVKPHLKLGVGFPPEDVGRCFHFEDKDVVLFVVC